MHVALIGHGPELDQRKDHTILAWTLLPNPEFTAIDYIEDCRHNGNNRRCKEQKNECTRAVEERLDEAFVQGPILG